MTLDEFLEKVCARPLPQNPIGRIRTLARELAEGTANDLWNNAIYFEQIPILNYFEERPAGWLDDVVEVPVHTAVREYLRRRWNKQYPRWELVEINGYVTFMPHDLKSSTMILIDHYGILTKSAFDLLDEVEPTNIFISYKRSESSAFALLVLSRLKQAGLEPFLDLDLVPGEDWEDGLRERIQKYGYLIALIGQQTLESKVCLQEIAWALEAKLQVIPVCHNGFEYNYDEWGSLPTDLREYLRRTHYIKVQVESAAEYDKALTLLLNRFGITP